MLTPNWIRELFSAIDARDAAGFSEFLSEDATFVYGNAPAVTGRDAIRGFVAGFFQSIAALEHRVVETWELADATICRGDVRYTRHDGSTLTIPFANILKRGADGRIGEYLIFADASALYSS